MIRRRRELEKHDVQVSAEIVVTIIFFFVVVVVVVVVFAVPPTGVKRSRSSCSRRQKVPSHRQHSVRIAFGLAAGSRDKGLNVEARFADSLQQKARSIEGHARQLLLQGRHFPERGVAQQPPHGGGRALSPPERLRPQALVEEVVEEALDVLRRREGDP